MKAILFTIQKLGFMIMNHNNEPVTESEYSDYLKSLNSGYYENFSKIKTTKQVFKRMEAIRKMYAEVIPYLKMEGFVAHRSKYPIAKDFFINDLYTPIEKVAFEVFYYDKRLPVFPQYPVLNYMVDFAIPKLKIAIELDGVQYHDIAKDTIRDEKLKKEGWKTFRVMGCECYTIFTMDDLLDYEQELPQHALIDFFINTVEGFATAIKMFYFNRPDDGNLFDLAIMSLKHHRIIEFEL